MDKQKQIEEIDSLIRQRIGRQYVYKPNFNKDGEQELGIYVYTSDIAKDLYNAGCRILKANEAVRKINEGDQASWIEGYKKGFNDGVQALQLQTKEKIDEITTKLIEE